MIKAIFTSAWINIKTLRFNFLQYFMLVMIFPCTYLIISVVSSGGANGLSSYGVGLFCSMLISMFVNMQAAGIAQSVGITVMEQYAAFKVKPIFVFLGQSVFHMMLILPFAAAILVFALCFGMAVSGAGFVLALLLSAVFLTFVSIVIGGLIPNPNLASPVINMLYMVIIMITPLYNDIGGMQGAVRTLYALNPFSHIVSLFSWSLGNGALCSPYISAAVLLALALLAALASIKRWGRAAAAEKLSVF